MNKFIPILSFLLVSINLFAYDIAINGVYYNLDNETKTATVTYNYQAPIQQINYNLPFEYVIDCPPIDFAHHGYFGTVTIPKSIKFDSQEYKVVAISDSAFYECYNLLQVNLPNSITSIGKYAFFKCNKLTSITIPNSVTSIGKYAFGGCEKLSSITIPNSVTSIGNFAFCKCMNLTSITIPNSVTSIDDGAFSYCENIVFFTVNIENKNFSTLDGILFNKDRTRLICYPNNKKGSSYTIPNSVKYIDLYAFNGVKNLEHVAISQTTAQVGINTVSIDLFANIHCYVDLGLPSGTLWATTNVGASHIDEYGDYYAWGETTTKSDYTDSNYSYHSNPTTLPLYRDVAYSKWGDNWRIPTMEEFIELFDSKNTIVEWAHIDNVYGCKITSLLNGNSIFLPAADFHMSTAQPGSECHYWSSSLSEGIMAKSIHANSKEYKFSHSTRYVGMPIRPVMTKKFPSYTTTNSSNLKTKKITSSPKATATIHKIWCEKNSYLKLIKIYLDFTVKNIDKIGRVTAYFYTESGEKLKDTNGKCCTTNGHVCVSKEFETEAYSTSFNDFMIYFLLNELHVTQRGNYKFFVEIKDNNSNVIGRSEWVKFSY